MAMIPQTAAQHGTEATHADGSGLGIHREIGVPPPVGERQIRRFALLDAARRLLPGERVASCMRQIMPGRSTVEVVFDPKHKAAHFKGLCTCSSSWVCPFCAAKISERRKEELQAGLLAHPEFHLVMATFTLQHRRGDALEGLLDKLKRGLKFARSGAPWKRIADRYGIQGSITATEITWGKGTGWHPHVHVLFLCSRELTSGEIGELKDFLTDRYGSEVCGNGGYVSADFGVDVRAMAAGGGDYVAKWGPSHELTKAMMKNGRGTDRIGPWGLLAMAADGDDQAGKLFQEYAAAVRGRRVLTYSRGLRDRLELGAEKTDEELATAEEEEAVVLATLNEHQWKTIVGNGARGELLGVAAKGNPEALWLWISQFWET